jgi:TRAP-type C4-dicarboxylate transport system permease small subunit
LFQISEHKLLSRLEGHLAGILKGFQYAGMSLVVVMMFLTVGNAVGRYGFNQTVSGIIELSSFLLIMIIFLSIASIQMKRNHIMVGIVVDRLKPKTQKIIDIINYSLTLAIVIVAVKETFLEGVRMSTSGEVSLALEIPFFPFYYLVAFGWAIFGLATLMNLIYFIYGVVKK